jgi:excisionase family DNA binding protein
MVVDIRIDTKTKAIEDFGWRVDSVCREHPTQLWFAASSRDIATAKALCDDCTVQSPCLEFALSRPELLGIWAATSPSERSILRRAARTAAAGAVVPQSDADDDVDDVVVPAMVRAAPVELDPGAKAPEDGRLPGEAGPPAPADRDPGSELDLDDTASDELLTPAEAARRLGVTPNTVTRWSRAGKISAIQTIGGHRRYRTSEIDRVLRRFGPLQ